jgi:preprotein translocase subunit SecB
MSDTAPAAAPGTISYALSAQYVKDLSFENPRSPQVFSMAGQQPQVAVAVGVSINKLNDTAYEVVLTLNADAKHNEEPVFVIELAYAGVVVASGQAPAEHLQPLLMIEIPRQLFPFARAILSNTTRDGGFPPLLLQPVDFEALYRQQQQEGQGKAPSSPIPGKAGAA